MKKDILDKLTDSVIAIIFAGIIISIGLAINYNMPNNEDIQYDVRPE